MISGGQRAASRIVPGLVSLLGNYPTKEGTSFWSLKLDHIWNNKNTSFIRASVSPSLVTGIQVNAENQNFGQNAGNRTSLQQTRDLDIVGQHTTAFRNDWFNEFRFQFARRGLHYGFSDLPGGDDPSRQHHRLRILWPRALRHRRSHRTPVPMDRRSHLDQRLPHHEIRRRLQFPACSARTPHRFSN